VPPTDPTLLDDLVWRGLVAHSTDLDALREALTQGSVRFYVGFDPTAPSMHMGNLVQLVTAIRLQRAGHTPFVLVGGATGMIGDPKESSERTLNDAATVKDWTERFRRQMEPYMSFDGENAATIVNNYDWTENLSTIDFLRDIGKHFPVNRMLARDVVKSRLEAGISYTEFSYVLLQSMDFLTLFRDHGVTLQFGGSDQWGNLTGGVELIRRADGGHAHAFATPLVTKADGTKYGKTEDGALWLDPEMMSPYAFFQFWLNVEDEKVEELLKIFTFLTAAEIESLVAEQEEFPSLRPGQNRLAREVTKLVHGDEGLDRAQWATNHLFKGEPFDPREMTISDLVGLVAILNDTNVSFQVPKSDPLPELVDLLVVAGLATSRSDARRGIQEGGVYVNNQRVTDVDSRPASHDLSGGVLLLLRRGKKRFAGIEFK
jgi:tyrosyl-tRNA synthetase